MITRRPGRAGIAARIAILALAAFAAAAAAATAAAGPTPPSSVAPGDGEAVWLEPAAAGARPAAQPDPGLVEIELQAFDGDAFPPEGWRTFDNDALARRREETYVWGTADCDLPAGLGNRFAAWSVGGGRLGAGLLCAAEYDQPAESWLVREGIDASAYAGGLVVSFDIRFDVPPWVERSPTDPDYVPPPVRVCGSTSTTGSFNCRGIFGPPGTEGRWLNTGENPVVLRTTAGQADAAVAFIYTDAEPDGLFSAAMIDNVRIQGLGEPPEPTATPEGHVPTVTPVPTTPVPTVPPTPFTPRDAQRAFLPVAQRAYDLVADSPGVVPTALPGRVDVVFGTDVDGTGRVDNAGYRFDFGIRRLCAKESWYDVAPGTTVRWQWYQYNGGAGRFDEIPGEPLNSSEVAQTAQGFASQCIRYVDPDGGEIPVPANRYKVAVFLRGEAFPMASGVAEVVGGSGPVPTAGPSPTPKPLPEGCSDPLVNGDFETGPGNGWVERTPSGEPIIRTEIALESTYAALFGRHLGSQESLASAVVLDTLPADRIESVELRMALAIITDETTGNGTNEDLFAMGVINEALTIDVVAAISEESFPPRQWRGITVDMSEAFQRRADFERVALGFVTQQSASSATNFIVDNVVLEICLTSGQRLTIPLSGAQRVPVGDVAMDVADALRHLDRADVGRAPLAERALLPEGWRTSVR